MGGAPGNILVPITLFGFPFFVMFLFKKFEHRHAAAMAYVAGWMFLPNAEYEIFLLRHTKTTVIGLGILASIYFFDKKRFSKFKLSAFDIPMLLWCTAPFFSSIFNDLGPYDGLSQALYQTIRWGLPYYIGRIYFTDQDALKILAITIVLGGIVYIPLCWFEMIMSPQLHRLTYGFHQHEFLQTLREGGGFRPMVYMEHGLMTSMWMMLAVILGSWLYYCKDLSERIFSVPSTYMLIMLVFTFFMMKSEGAIVLLVIGLTVLFVSNKLKQIILIAILLITPYLYIFTRINSIWDGRNLSNYVAETFSPVRAQSLQFRFDNETILIVKAMQGTVFGWGGYGRSRVYDENGKDISVTDGLWIITLGQNGIYGLITLAISIQLPAILFALRFKPEEWNKKGIAAPTVMAIFLAITMIDNLLNAMVNPIYMLFSGGLTGMVLNNSLSLADGSETKKLQQAEETPVTRFIAGSN
jgi:hypothetical protein